MGGFLTCRRERGPYRKQAGITRRPSLIPPRTLSSARLICVEDKDAPVRWETLYNGIRHVTSAPCKKGLRTTYRTRQET